MDLRHEFTVPATFEETWTAFNDIESVAVCFPGASVGSVEGDTFTGSCKVKLGPIALVYNGTGTFVEKDEAAGRMVIDAKGKDKRGNGTAGAHVTATLTREGTSTRVEVLTDLAVTGKPAQFGRGVMQDVSDKLLGQFTACLEQKLSGAGAAAPEVAAAPAPEISPGEVPDRGAGAPAAAPAGAAGGSGPLGVAGDEPLASAGGAGAAPPSAGFEPRETVRPGNDEALDLGATVLPVLAKAYWKQAAGVLVVLLVVVRLLSRRRH